MRKPFARPGSRPRYAPDRLVDVKHILIDIKLDFDKRRIAGSCATTLSPLSPEVRWIALDAVEMQIKRVREGSTDLGFDHDGKQLRIDLQKIARARRQPGQDVTIVVDYAAQPRRGLYFIGPDAGYPERRLQAWSQGQDEDSRYWFPCFDSPHEKATSEVIATVPERFFALSNGTLVSRKDGKGTTRFHWKLDVPHSCYLITLAAGEYTELRADAAAPGKGKDGKAGKAKAPAKTKAVKAEVSAAAPAGPEILYYAPRGREEETLRTLARTPEMLALFSEFTGVPYPYGKYAQVFASEFIFGGMENTTATTLTDNVLYDERAAIDYDVDSLVAHELAHQWFGDLLTCRDWGQGWLNEGFATYAEYLWAERWKGRDEAAFERAEFQDQYLREDRDQYRRPIATNMFEVPIDLFDHHLYEKGACVLHMLRRTLGEDMFKRAIHHYVQKHQQGSVETRDLARATEDATGRNLDWFFDQWVMRAGHPELKVELGWDEDKKIARVSVKQSQKVDVVSGPVLFRLPTEVLFVVAGKAHRFPLEVRDEQEAFFFPLEARPHIAIFDPGDHLLKSIDTDKPLPMWRHQLSAAPDVVEAIDRAAAASALGKHSDADTLAALGRAVLKDKHYAVRAAAAAALAQIRNEAARTALLAGLATDHPKARRAVVRALGAFKFDDVVAASLVTLLETGDESYFVEAEAASALARTRAAAAWDALTAHDGPLMRDSFQDVIRQHALRGLSELRDPRALSVLTEWTRYGHLHSSFARRAAVDGLARHAEGREGDTRAAREVLELLLEDPDFRVQMTTIGALATLGDARAVPALARCADRDLDGRVKRRCRDVIRDLRDGRSREEGLRLCKDETERLDREMKKLRERLAAVEARLAPKKHPH